MNFCIFRPKTDPLTLSDPDYLDTLNTWGGLIQPAGKRWPLEASEATVEATKQKNIVPDIVLYHTVGIMG